MYLSFCESQKRLYFPFQTNLVKGDQTHKDTEGHHAPAKLDLKKHGHHTFH